MKIALALFCQAVLAAAVLAAPPTLTLPAEVKGDVTAFIKIPAVTTGKNVQWVSLDQGLNVFPIDQLKDTKTAIVTSARAGRYRMLAYTALADELSEPAICVVVVGQPGPEPGPGPTPPTPPTPPPTPAPISAPGLHVLIVENSRERANLKPEQLGILFDKKFRDYLDSKCVDDAEAGRKAWNIWTEKTDVSSIPKKWQDAMKRDRKSMPWIIVSNPSKGGFEGPLPENVDKTIELIKKYEE